jgi:DNA-binding beta-propeller fold protein YncE
MSISSPPRHSASFPGLASLLLVVSVLLLRWAPLVAQSSSAAISGGDGTIYASTYSDLITVISERDFEVVGQIQTQNGIPGRFVLSADRRHLYVSDATGFFIETIDLSARRSIDSFSIGSGNERFRIQSFAVDPEETYAIILGKTRIEHIDRFEVGAATLLRYDLRNHEVMDTIPWPGGHERERVSFMFSPDGSLVYFSAEDLIVLESENFTEVDRWEVSQELEPGQGRVSPGFNESYYEEPGHFTGLVRITDPVNHRRMMGIARVDLAEQDMDFHTLGPDEPVGRFALAPGGKKAWALYSEVGRYEFWAIDLDRGRVTHREIFQGRPRMGLDVSTNGELLYIHVAGNTIDLYDSKTYKHLDTVDVGGDMRGFILLPAPDAP